MGWMLHSWISWFPRLVLYCQWSFEAWNLRLRRCKMAAHWFNGACSWTDRIGFGNVRHFDLIRSSFLGLARHGWTKRCLFQLKLRENQSPGLLRLQVPHERVVHIESASSGPVKVAVTSFGLSRLTMIHNPPLISSKVAHVLECN